MSGMAKHVRSESRSLIAAILVLVPGCAAEAGAAREQLAGDPPAEAAQAAVSPAVSGRYRYAGGEPQRQQLLDAIEEVVADMVFLARPIARRRLRDGNLPSEELQIDVTGDKITIVRPGRPTVSAPRDGSPIVWKSPDGDEFKVRHILRGDREFTQEFVGDGNRSSNDFKLGDDGKSLVVHTTITADRLPRVLRFRMSYRRSG